MSYDKEDILARLRARISCVVYHTTAIGQEKKWGQKEKGHTYFVVIAKECSD